MLVRVKSLRSKLLAVVALGLVAGALVAVTRLSSSRSVPPAGVGERERATGTDPAPLAEPSAAGRAVLNRGWFDRLPSSPKDDSVFWVFLSGGIGVQISGSYYRWSTELFDLERQKSSLELVTLQDKKTIRFSFEIKRCDDKPPFDLCLFLSEPLRGKKVLYGFGDEGDAAHRYDWFRQLRGHSRPLEANHELGRGPSLEQ